MRTDVDIVSVANNIGGILGTANKSMSITSTFAAGEIYSKTGALDKVGRIYGSGIGTAKVTASRCFAYEGQNINGKQNTDRLDAYALMSADTMSGANAKIGWSRRVGLGSGFRLLGSDSPESVYGLLPYLRDEDGSGLLSGQTPHLMKDQALKMNKVIAAKDVPGKTDSTYPYQLNISFVQSKEKELYTVESVAVEGMNVAEPKDGKYEPDTKTQESETDGTVTTQFYVYTGLASYQDNYRVTLKVKKGNAEQTLSGVLQFEEKDIPYLEIHNIEEWKQYLGSNADERNLGQRYQNIRIAGEVNFAGLTSTQLRNYLNVRAAKVTATEAGKLTNLTYSAARAGEAVFADISGDLDSLAFENMSLDVSSYGGSSIGIIGHLQGNGEKLKFTNITVKAGAATEVGTIGTTEGTLTDITLHNINVTASGDYVGGLTGVSRGNISNVTLTGDVGGTAANPTYGTNVINIGSYLGTGGLVGAPYAAFEKISVSGTHVSGYRYVGGMSGYTNENTNNDITVGSDVISKDASGEKIYDVFVESTSYYVGGVSGYGTSGSNGIDVNYFKNVTVQNARVTTRGSEASGIARVIRAEDVTVKGSYIYAASSFAGGVADAWSTVYRATVTDSIISARKLCRWYWWRLCPYSGLHHYRLHDYGRQICRWCLWIQL